jgi:hypothetical protein
VNKRSGPINAHRRGHELPCPCPLCTRETWQYWYRDDRAAGHRVRVIKVACEHCRRRSVLVVADVGPVDGMPEVDEDILVRSIGRWIDS